MTWFKPNRSWGTFVAATTLCLGGSTVAAAPPPNDTIVNATVIRSLPFSARVDTTEATSASDDPVYAGQGSTVWYTFTPSTSVRVLIDTAGSDYDTTLSVYTGAPGALTQIAWDDDGVSENGQSRVLLKAEGGVTYHVMVGAFAGSTPGRLVLSAKVGPPPLTAGLRFQPEGVLDPQTGVAVVRGKIICSEPAVVGISGNLSQAAGAAGSVFTYLVCDGETDWSAEVTSSRDARFSRGSTRITARAMVSSETTGEYVDVSTSADLTLVDR